MDNSLSEVKFAFILQRCGCFPKLNRVLSSLPLLDRQSKGCLKHSGSLRIRLALRKSWVCLGPDSRTCLWSSWRHHIIQRHTDSMLEDPKGKTNSRKRRLPKHQEFQPRDFRYRVEQDLSDDDDFLIYNTWHTIMSWAHHELLRAFLPIVRLIAHIIFIQFVLIVPI